MHDYYSIKDISLGTLESKKKIELFFHFLTFKKIECFFTFGYDHAVT